MVLAGPADYLFVWHFPIVVFYLAAWLIGGMYVMNWALAKMTDLPNRHRTLVRAFQLNALRTGGGLMALGVLLLAFVKLAGRTEGGKVDTMMMGAALAFPVMLAAAWAIGMVMLNLSAKRVFKIMAVTTGSLAVLAMVIAFVSFGPTRRRRLANLHVDRCKDRVAVLLGVLTARARRKLGKEAPSLQTLIKDNPANEEMILCPANRKGPPYWYIPTSKVAVSDAIRVCDRKGNHPGERVVGFADGQTRLVPEKWFRDLLEQPENADLKEMIEAEEGK